MRWGTPWEEQRKAYAVPQGKQWQDWFAWYPIRTRVPNDKWIWLETVQYRYWDGMSYNVVEYREKQL